MSTSRLIIGVADSTLERDRDQLDQALARLLAQFLQARTVTVLHLYEDESIRHVLQRAAASGTDAVVSPFATSSGPPLSDEPAWQECVRNNRVVESVAEGGYLSTAFPLHTKGEIVGLLVVETASSLPVPQIDLVYGILRIVENHLALLDYGERDTLTGLLNRKTFESQFEKIRQRASSTIGPQVAAEPSWLALVDIDRFKSINDNFGHLFGDEVLLLVSQMMKRSFRGADQLFRFGGEEFLIMLDHASEHGVHIALDRFRASIASFSFPQVGTVTISLGYTRVLPADVATTCVERADAALYYAKNHGRNHVSHYETLIAAGELKSKAEKNEDVELF